MCVHVLTTVQRSSMKLRKRSWNGQKIGCKTVNDLVLCTYHVIELLPGIVWNWVNLCQIFVQNCVDFQIYWNLSGEELNWNVAWK